MNDLFPEEPISLREMVEEAERELHVRLSVYARSVARGKMSQSRADRYIRLQQAILATLRVMEELS
jgi:hypothetical protein